MLLAEFEALVGDEGQRALAEAVARQPDDETFLSHFTQLEKCYPRAVVRCALETALLRRKAAVKFPAWADVMYFTREGLEMASGAGIAAYRAGRYAGARTVVDLACGLGGDLVALAGVAQGVTGIDRDDLAVALARANLRAVGRMATVVQADVRQWTPSGGEWVFFDPGRRSGGRRIQHVRDYQPPLSVVDGWLGQVGGLGVKLSPGVAIDELAAYLPQAELEFISVAGELKEAVLWLGGLRHESARRATLLPEGGDTPIATLTGGRADEIELVLSDPQAVLYEPDPAVLRAGLVRHLARDLGAAMLSDDIAFLTAAERVATPWVRAYQIEDWLPFSKKRLEAYLQARGVGRVVVKKRGSPLDVAQFERSLKLTGDPAVWRTVVLTQVRGRAVMIVCGTEVGDGRGAL